MNKQRSMGKASKWFSKLLGRRRKSLSNHSYTHSPDCNGGDAGVVLDPNEHATAVAAATAAAAEAALAAVRAAEEVVRLTNNATPSNTVACSRRWSFEDLAAVKIQSVFRGFLARKALRALKGLVRLQALVRGHFVRKQSTDFLRRLQALVRVQHRALANRVQNLGSTPTSRENSTRYEIHVRSTERVEDSSALKRSGSITSIKKANWLENWVEAGSSVNSPIPMKISHADDEKSDKILEIDSWKPQSKPRSRSQTYLRTQPHITVQDYYNRSFAASDYLARYSPSHLLHKPGVAEDVASLKSLNFPHEASESARKSPKTPLRDHECPRSFLSGSPSPSYMANTQSSRARARSQSVPRLRGDPEKGSSSKRSLNALWELRTSLRRSSEPLF